MGKQGGISGIGVAAVTGATVLLWSALKGKAWSATVRDLIKGSVPLSTQDYPINTASSTVAPGAASPGTGTSTTPAVGKQVCASQYGGSGDPTAGSHGYHGDNLNGTMAYAELMMGTALGHLPYRQKAKITFNGKTVVGEKLDIGRGGAGCGGHPRALDLWWETAQAIGFNGLGVVTFEPI